MSGWCCCQLCKRLLSTGKCSVILHLHQDSNLWTYSNSKAYVKHQENFLTIGTGGKMAGLWSQDDQKNVSWLEVSSWTTWTFVPGISTICFFLAHTLIFKASLCHIQIPAASSLFCWPYAFEHRAVCYAWQAGKLQGHPAGTMQRRNTGKGSEEGRRNILALRLGGSVTNTTNIDSVPQCHWAS